MQVAIAWGNALNGHAVAVRDRKRDRIIGKLQKRFRELCAQGGRPREIFEVRAALDRIGRTGGTLIKPPEVDKLTIDSAVAELFGVSPWTVRRIRTGPRMQPFMARPFWEEQDWERIARQDFEVRQVARDLMTPERYAKGEPVRIFSGGLQVLERAPTEPEPTNPKYRPPASMQLEAHDGQPDWFAMQSWLVEMEGVSEALAARKARKKKKRGGIGGGGCMELSNMTAPYPPVTSAPVMVPPYANFGPKDPD